MKKIVYLEKPAGLVLLGIKGAGPLSSLGVGKHLDDGTVLSSMELDDNGVVHFKKTTKDGQPVKVKVTVGSRVFESHESCIHASLLKGFMLDDDSEQPAKPVQQQGQNNQRR